MRFTTTQYNTAIQALWDGSCQLEPDGQNCSICSDTDHQAWECHHNPLLAMELVTYYRCFHCGELFKGDAAEEHFGIDGMEKAACIREHAKERDGT